MQRKNLTQALESTKSSICLGGSEFDYLSVFRDVLPTSPLTKLDVSFRDNHHPNAEFCDALSLCKNLATLTIYESYDANFTEFSDNIDKLSLDTLEIVECNLTKFIISSSLTSLSLQCNPVQLDEYDKLDLHNLTSLDLYSNDIGCHGAEVIANSLPESRLTYLDLSCNAIGENGITALAHALPFSLLETLELRFNNIGDKELSHITDVLSSTSLTNLNLQSNRITSLGAKSLAEVLSSCKITSLCLLANSIGSKGLKYLVDIFPESPLKELNVGHNAIGNNGALLLAEIIPHCNLTELQYYGNNFNEHHESLILDSLQRNFTIVDDNVLPPNKRLEHYLSKTKMKSSASNII